MPFLLSIVCAFHQNKKIVGAIHMLILIITLRNRQLLTINNFGCFMGRSKENKKKKMTFTLNVCQCPTLVFCVSRTEVILLVGQGTGFVGLRFPMSQERETSPSQQHCHATQDRIA
jgi:hypothetical protein